MSKEYQMSNNRLSLLHINYINFTHNLYFQSMQTYLNLLLNIFCYRKSVELRNAKIFKIKTQRKAQNCK
jgi:hypothetical protein